MIPYHFDCCPRRTFFDEAAESCRKLENEDRLQGVYASLVPVGY